VYKSLEEAQRNHPDGWIFHPFTEFVEENFPEFSQKGEGEEE